MSAVRICSVPLLYSVAYGSGRPPKPRIDIGFDSLTECNLFPFSSAVEQRAVNSKVVGSNPARGANTFGKVGTSTAVANVGLGVGSNPTMKYLNLVASAHGGDLKISNNPNHGVWPSWLRHLADNEEIGGSNPPSPTIWGKSTSGCASGRRHEVWVRVPNTPQNME